MVDGPHNRGGVPPAGGERRHLGRRSSARSLVVRSAKASLLRAPPLVPRRLLIGQKPAAAPRHRTRQRRFVPPILPTGPRRPGLPGSTCASTPPPARRSGSATTPTPTCPSCSKATGPSKGAHPPRAKARASRRCRSNRRLPGFSLPSAPRKRDRYRARVVLAAASGASHRCATRTERAAGCHGGRRTRPTTSATRRRSGARKRWANANACTRVVGWGVWGFDRVVGARWSCSWMWR
jgi:hypothetical protein